MLYIKSYIKPRSIEEYTHEFRIDGEIDTEKYSLAETLASILAEEITIYD
jgi:hypothetical protein